MQTQWKNKKRYSNMNLNEKENMEYCIGQKNVEPIKNTV